MTATKFCLLASFLEVLVSLNRTTEIVFDQQKAEERSNSVIGRVVLTVNGNSHQRVLGHTNSASRT